MMKQLEDIAAYIESLSFRKKLLFGVDEGDVWKKIQQLHGYYQEVMTLQEEKYQAVIEEKNKEIQRLQQQLYGDHT